MLIDLYEQLIALELLLIKFNVLASSFPAVIKACFLILSLHVTTATAKGAFQN